MAIDTFDPVGRKLETEEEANWFAARADKVIHIKAPRFAELEEQKMTVSGAVMDATSSCLLQWYEAKQSSMANPIDVLELEAVPPVPYEPSEDELLNSWERYFKEHWEELVAQHKGKYVAIWDNAVYDSDEDLAALAERVYAALGYRPIFMPYIGRRISVAEFLSPA